MVSGTDEHGTPITVAADAEGITPREIADRNNRIIVDDLAVARAELRPLHPDDDGQPRRDQPGDLPGPAEERLRLPEDDARRDQPVDRPHPARPLHRGHLPDLRLRRRPRRPVRQLRQPARPDRPDQPGQQDQRRDAEVRRGGALLPRPAGLRPGARRLAGHAQELAAQRPELQRQPARRPQAAQLHPRHRLGRARCRWTAGSTGPDKRIYVWFDAVVGYLSASIEWARRSGDPEAWRQWWQTPDSDAYYFMGKDNIVFHSEIWPAQLLGYNGEGDKGGTPGSLGRLNLPTEVVSSEFLTMEGRKFSSLAPGRHLRARLPRPVRRRRAALLHRRRRAGEPGHRLHLGGVPAPQQRRARRRLGQPGQPHGLDGGQERRRRPDAGRADRRRPRPAGHDVGRLRARSATCCRATGRRPRSTRRCGSSARRTSTCRTRRRGSSRRTRPAGTPCCTPRCRRSRTATPC